jgi:hypothetical protein
MKDQERGGLSRARLNNQFGLWCRSERNVMSDKAYKAAQLCLALYVAMAVICFGPATVQSEEARAEHQAQCRAVNAGDAEQLRRCSIGGPSVSDGAPKAIFWPLWLSYMAASR